MRPLPRLLWLEFPWLCHQRRSPGDDLPPLGRRRPGEEKRQFKSAKLLQMARKRCPSVFVKE